MRSSVLLKLVACVAVLGFAFALPAEAASPASGTLSKAKRALKWSGSFNLSFPAYSDTDPVIDFNCKDMTADACDHYALKINLGENAMIEVKIIAVEPCPPGCLAPADGNDIDLYVYAPNGASMGVGGTDTGVEKVRFKHKAKYRNKAYDIGVLPWFVRPGMTYKGTVTAITLGK